MKKLISIIVLFSSSLFANEYSPENIIEFIKKSEKIIIKLASFDSETNKFIEYVDNSKNYYVVINNKDNILVKETFDRINNTIIEWSIRRYDNDKIVTTGKLSSYMVKKGLDNYDEGDTSYSVVLENNEFFSIQPCYKGNEQEICKSMLQGYKGGFGGYCTDRKDLSKYGVVKCEAVDKNDITAKPLMSIDKFVDKIISIYDAGTKTYFNLNNDIGIEVVQIDTNKPKSILKLPPKKEIKPKVNKVIGSGSGFYITNKGHIITNNHVIDKCEKILLNDEVVELLSTNKKVDLALLKSQNTDTPFLYLRQNQIKQGEDVVVIGYPFGKEVSTASKITKGIVSALIGLGNDDSKIQIDAAIQPGNSGGPTIGLDGQVVGVTVASANIAAFLKVYGTIAQSMNFSVKPKYVIQIMKANGVEVPFSNENLQMNTAEIYEYANPATLYLECWGRN